MRTTVRHQPKVSKTKILIIMPCGLDRKIDAGAAVWCARQLSRWECLWEIVPARQAEDARNHAIQKYIGDQTITHFFFLDADTIPPMDGLERLLRRDKAFVAGVTPIYNWNTKKKSWNVSLTDTETKKEMISREPDELPSVLFQAQGVGGTTILCKRELMLRMKRPYFFTRRNEEGELTMSEDLHFTSEILKFGYKLWVDPQVKCVHRQTNDLD